VQKHFTRTPEQNDWQEVKPLFGGGKIKICDTLRAVTPFGDLSVPRSSVSGGRCGAGSLVGLLGSQAVTVWI
jgi:hypothetical protein